MPQESSSQQQREIPQDSLQVLFDLKIAEGIDTNGKGWRVNVVEHLRLRVPSEARGAWIQAELESWDPWLRQQHGFLGREILWDSELQEGILMIHWADRQAWKAIPEHQVLAIQKTFEIRARQLLNLPNDSPNPFPLVHSSETSFDP